MKVMDLKDLKAEIQARLAEQQARPAPNSVTLFVDEEEASHLMRTASGRPDIEIAEIQVTDKGTIRIMLQHNQEVSHRLKDAYPEA